MYGLLALIIAAGLALWFGRNKQSPEAYPHDFHEALDDMEQAEFASSQGEQSSDATVSQQEQSDTDLPSDSSGPEDEDTLGRLMRKNNQKYLM